MKARLLTPLIGTIWLCAIAVGQRMVLQYETSPGSQAAAPADWPAASQVHRSPGLPTLVILAHPQCPCTHATMEELNVLLGRCQGRLSAAVLFFKPPRAANNWERTALWREAQGIPGVQVLCDEGGLEARRFHVLTSGQANLYDRQGRLVFSGGITGSRGHQGDNPGLEAIISLVLTGKATLKKCPVFGCSLISPGSALPPPQRSSRSGGSE